MSGAAGGAGGVHIICRRKYPGFTAVVSQGMMGFVVSGWVRVERRGVGLTSCCSNS